MRSAALLLLFLIPGAATPQELVISTEGTATLSLAGHCHPSNLGVVSSAGEEPQPLRRTPGAPASASELPLLSNIERKCVRRLGKFCRRVCRRESRLPACCHCGEETRVCTVGQSLPDACADDPTPGASIEITEQVHVRVDYSPFELASHQWGCTVTVERRNGETMTGTCGVPSQAPAFDRSANVYLLPFHAHDRVEKDILDNAGSFGDIRGYLVVDLFLLEHPAQAGPENIRGLTGQLTYQVGDTWLYNLLLPSPWTFRPPLDAGDVCVVSGRIHFGEIAKY